MASVKRTFSIPKEVSQDLDGLVPPRERSKFIVLSLQEALAKKKQQSFAAMLNALQPTPNSLGISSEQALREDRENRADDMLTHSR